LTFLNQFFLGFKSYQSAFKYIDDNRLWKLFLLPSLIALLISILIGYLAWISSDDIVEYLVRIFQIRDLTDFWGVIIEFTFVMLIRGLTLFIFLKFYRYFVLFFLAPALGYTSQRIYCIHRKTDFSFGMKVFGRKVSRAWLVAFRNLILEIPLTVVILFLTLVITWLAPLGPFIILVLESYFFGLAMIDYRNACMGMSMKESRKYSQNNFGLAIGNGICFNLILLVPIIGVMVAPVLALIAGGMAANENENKVSDGDNID